MSCNKNCNQGRECDCAANVDPLDAVFILAVVLGVSGWIVSAIMIWWIVAP